MSLLSPQWSVRKVTTDYAVKSTGSYIVYRPNAQSEAVMMFNDNNGDFTNVFVEEDEVTVKIGSTNMMVGYIDNLETIRNPNGSRDISLHITDWGGYLGAKTIFEKEYKREKSASQVLADASAEIAMLSTNITGLNTVGKELKRFFNGTYVRDGWYSAVEAGGGEYFVDETKTLQAFEHDTRDLEESPTNRYRIRDIPPSLSRDLMVDHNFAYKWANNVTNRYRSVVVSSGIAETYPPMIDTFQQLHFKDDERGKTYSQYYNTLINQYNIDDTEIEPVAIEGSTGVDSNGELTIPTVKTLVVDSSSSVSVNLRSITRDEDGVNNVLGSFNLDYLQWQRIGFFMKKALTGATVTAIELQLVDTAGNFWSKQILSDYVSGETSGGTDFVYMEIPLPATTTDQSVWTKTGSPLLVNRIAIIITPDNGYNAKSYMEWGMMHFFRRRRASSTSAGSPATQKIIVDSRNKGDRGLQTLANAEQLRSNVVAKIGSFTIDGNTDFKNPAYNIDVDFTTTLGTGRSGVVRINEIRHTLNEGIHKTNVLFNNSFNRP
jgi:hypothetical protein